MKPAWDKLGSKYKDHASVMIVDVDCTADGAQTCQKMGVQGYPTIKYFLAGGQEREGLPTREEITDSLLRVYEENLRRGEVRREDEESVQTERNRVD